ncbi:MAG: glycosyltransferase [Flavobacteriaceae bacterium]|nr:glycosyltransferase [Flavobacteriaceae bacterium]NNE15822.1 glycosyltransferase [Saprospiraceae bacterium]
MNNITIISGYYFPEDTAIGLYNTQLVKFLESKGYIVTVVTGFPSYPQWKIREDYNNKKAFYTEFIGKTKIIRYKQFVPKSPTFFKRILLLLDFTFGSFFNVFKIKDCDLVISVVPHTSTLFLGWVLKKRKKAKLWNHIQDFEFDAAHQTGLSSNTSLMKKILFRTLFKMESALLNRGVVNSTISYKMISKLKTKSHRPTFYFPNWIDESKIDPSSANPHSYLSSSKFKILYSGNIGDKQDWEFFIDFATCLDRKKVEIIVVGDGAKREWLHKKISQLEIAKYYEPVAYEELTDLLCSADLHFLFQKHDVIDSVMPSKLLGMMASGVPSLITGNIESEVNLVINESKGGFYVNERNISKCLTIVEELIEDPSKGVEIGKKARNYVIDKFASEKVLSKFESMIENVLNE